MKRLKGVLAASAWLILAPGVIAVFAASDGIESGGKRPSRVIRLVERVTDFTFQDTGAPGPSLGDRLIFTSDLYDEDDRKVGRHGVDCVVMRIDADAPAEDQQIVQCTIPMQLPDGQLTFQGLAQGTENYFAITGGTGAYRTARGEALAVDRVPLQVADVTISLYR